MSHLAARLIASVVVLAILVGCTTPERRSVSIPSQVLFVCEHGNVKSLMAASYFNELAQARGLAFRGISRGSAPDSDSVPPKIVTGLSGDGFDVSAFHPAALSASDVSASITVVAIGVPLAKELVGGASFAQWNDVPPASVDYAAARASLKKHVEQLLGELAAEW